MHVANVDEAIALATEFKQAGRYDWFRGQTRNFPVVASFYRRDEAERERTLEALARFEAWVKATPGLEGLASQGVDAMIAVAQHHGLPTSFVDFTTEPATAGFFASDAPQLDPRELSCIVCLDTADLVEFWKVMPSRYPPPECVRVDVSNLWRLQAQDGVFLFNPYPSIEQIYSFDRILFPAGKRADATAREQIYPPRKSQLEILLDQYFMNERLVEGDRALARARSMMHVIEWQAPADGMNPELTASVGVPVLASWSQRELTAWRTTHDERLIDARTDVSVPVRVAAEDGADVARRVAGQVLTAMAREPALRLQLVTWALEPPHTTLQPALDWLWDGLRTLPYDDKDVAAAIGNCVALSIAYDAVRSTSGDPWARAAEALFGSAVEVELAGPDGSYARAYVGADDLLRCVRDDIASHLAPAFRDQIVGNAHGMLQAVQAPERLYEFDRIVRLFARQVRPMQVLMRSGEAVYFSPARVARIGLP